MGVSAPVKYALHQFAADLLGSGHGVMLRFLACLCSLLPPRRSWSVYPSLSSPAECSSAGKQSWRRGCVKRCASSDKRAFFSSSAHSTVIPLRGNASYS